MTTLAEAYDRRVGEAERLQRIYLGLGISGVGVLMFFLGGIIGVAMPVAALFGASNPTEQWGLGGILAGFGIPIALAGLYVVVPTTRENLAIAASGIGLGLLGVLTFVVVYPNMWHGDPTDLTWLVFVLYAGGAIVDIWALFRSVLDIEIALPTNRLELRYEGREAPEESASTTSTVVQDGGVGISTDVAGGTDAEIMAGEDPGDAGDDERDGRFSGDRYCGNCAHYDYLDDGAGDSQPYCRFHEETLDDLTACDHYAVTVGAPER